MRATMTAFGAAANTADDAGAYDDDLAYIHAVGFGEFAETLAAPLAQAIRAFATGGETVLDIGCGAGATTAALAAAGFEVIGYEPSPTLAASTRAAAPSARIVERSIYDVALPPCAAIVALGEPLTYHPDAQTADERLAAFFSGAASALRSGGRLIFDMISPDGPAFPPRGGASGPDWAVLVKTQESGGMLERRIETFRAVGSLYRRGEAAHRVRLLPEDAVRDALATAGFRHLTPTAPFDAHPLLRRRFYVAERG